MTVIARLKLNVIFHKLLSIIDYFYPYTNNEVYGTLRISSHKILNIR